MSEIVPYRADQLSEEETKILALRYAAFKGDLEAIAAYLEQGGDPNIQFLNGKEKINLLDEAMEGCDAWQHYYFGTPPVQNMEEGQDLLIKMAKMLLVSGFYIDEQHEILEQMESAKPKHKDTLFQPKHKVASYLSGVLHNRLPLPTAQSLREDGVPFDLNAREQFLEQQHHVLKKNADTAPGLTLGVPLNTDGKIVARPEKSPQAMI